MILILIFLKTLILFSILIIILLSLDIVIDYSIIIFVLIILIFFLFISCLKGIFHGIILGILILSFYFLYLLKLFIKKVILIILQFYDKVYSIYTIFISLNSIKNLIEKKNQFKAKYPWRFRFILIGFKNITGGTIIFLLIWKLEEILIYRSRFYINWSILLYNICDRNLFKRSYGIPQRALL